MENEHVQRFKLDANASTNRREPVPVERSSEQRDMGRTSGLDRLRVLRVYHGGRNSAHRRRETALDATGDIDLTLVVPSVWPEQAAEPLISDGQYSIIELEVQRAGDVNRHRYDSASALRSLIREIDPHVLDLHEEPFSVSVRQWLAASSPELPVVAYTAQNVDKRFPPPFAQFERAAHHRLSALYPCSAQAASVARGKGFAGLVEVLPLGYDETFLRAGTQSFEDDELVFGFFGRLVPEKGLLDAIRVTASLNQVRPARLIVCGGGPDERRARTLAASLGIAEHVEIEGWKSGSKLAGIYRSTHIVLIPSRPTETWVEQFGRVIVEAQASGAVVAGYDSGTIREVGGEAALLVDPGDVDALGSAVVSLSLDPEDFSRRRKLGLEASQTRTWSSVAERQAAIYRRVLDGPNDPLSLPSISICSTGSGTGRVWTDCAHDRGPATIRPPVSTARRAWPDAARRHYRHGGRSQESPHRRSVSSGRSTPQIAVELKQLLRRPLWCELRASFATALGQCLAELRIGMKPPQRGGELFRIARHREQAVYL